MSVSVCLSVRLSVSEHISGNTRPIITNVFVHVTCGRGSVLLWRYVMNDTLCTSGCMDYVILTHKPRQFNVAVKPIEAQPTCSLGLGDAVNGAQEYPLRANGLTLTGLLFRRRGLGLLGHSGRVEYS